MAFWWWVLIFGGIAAVALALYGILGLRLWRKTRLLLSDLRRLSATTAKLELAARHRTTTDDYSA